MQDLNGREIEVGNYIVYPALWSRSAILKFGKVVKINPLTIDKYGSAKPETISMLGVEYQSYEKDIKFIPNQTISALKFDYRLMVIDASAINLEAKKLLDAMWDVYKNNGKWKLAWDEISEFAKKVKNS